MLRLRLRAWLAAALVSLASASAAGEPPVDVLPRAARAYAVVVDGQLKWARGLDRPHAPASLTKLLTALVLLERDWDSRAIVTVSARAAAARGSRIDLRAGERVPAGDLLTAMLVRSGNDACAALVEHHAKTHAAFIERLNQRASELEMRASRFIDPCGLDAEGQHTTVRDLLRLGAAAIVQSEIAERARMPNATIATLAGRRIRFNNNNALIGREAGVIGLKSGFTNAAGKCVLAFAERDTHRVWIVLLDAPNRWWTAAGLLAAATDPMSELDLQ